jgi:hypothetical protein
MTRMARQAAERGAELVVFPELSVTGYPPRDLVERRRFVDRSEDGIRRLAAATADLPLAVIAGYVGRSAEASGKQTTNSAAILQGGRILLRQNKMLLPTYDVFDEGRNFVSFQTHHESPPLSVDGKHLARLASKKVHAVKRGIFDVLRQSEDRPGAVLIHPPASGYRIGRRDRWWAGHLPLSGSSALAPPAR